MKRTYITSAIIGAAALGTAFAAAAGQSYRADYPAMVQLQQNAQAEYQNKMREWSVGLSVDLPGAPPLASAARSAPVTAGVSVQTTEQSCPTTNYQSMRHLQLAKETEHQRRMREWATGLGIALPGAISTPDMLASRTSIAHNCIR